MDKFFDFLIDRLVIDQDFRNLRCEAVPDGSHRKASFLEQQPGAGFINGLFLDGLPQP